MTEKNADRETLTSLLLVDRQVYETRLWAQQWLALAGGLLVVFICFLVFIQGSFTIADLVSMAVVLLTGCYLSRRERISKQALLAFKLKHFEGKTKYYRTEAGDEL